jgi:pilus assembly protein CpaB
VVSTRFVTRQAAARGDVPEGLQEVTVPLEPARAVGGRLSPGDTVGVFLSFDPFDTSRDGDKTPNTTHLELHKVLVTGVQIENAQNLSAQESSSDEEDADRPSQAASGTYLVTLAVDSAAAEKVVFAAEHGFVWLSAEPEDADEGGTEIVTRGNVYETEASR